MHYLTYVFVPKNTDIKEAVELAMAPFDEDLEVEPWVRHLDPGEIAAMAKHYGLRRSALRKLAARMEDWNGGRGGVDQRGLYAVLTHNPDGKWDWYEIGGRWDGWLRGNVMTARALLRSPRLPDRLPHDFLTPDWQWHAKSRYVPTGWGEGHMVHTAPRRWLEQFRRALATWPDHRVVCVDRHC